MEDGKSVVVKTARYDGITQPTNGLMGAEWRECPESMASSSVAKLKAAFASYRYIVVL